MPSYPSPRGSNFRRFFDIRIEKTMIFWESSLCEKNCVFSAGPKLLLRKIPKKSDFFGESFGIHFVAFFFVVVMFFHCVFWVVHDFRRTVRKNGLFSCPEKMTLFRASKNAVFSGHGSRMTVRKNPGYLAGWLADSLAGWLFGNWLRGWLAGYSAISYLAGWLAGCLALAIWLVIWMAGSLACYLAI